MTDAFDGIILGTGHNALVLQAYLCRAGLKVLSVDRAEVAGGGLTTIENPRLPGFLHNTHSFFHRALTAMPWYRDLELEKQGVRYIEPELNVALICPDGRVLEWWTDLDRTLNSVAEFSKKDAATLRRWAEEFHPVVERILIPEAQSPPVSPERRRELLARSALGRRLLDVSALSPVEFVQQEFENETVQAGLLFFNGLREIDPRLPGFGHAIPALLAGRHKAQMCVGGSARLAEALVGDIRIHSGQVRTNVRLSSILIEHNRAAGIRLADGEELRARSFVASGLNPQQTFLDLLPSDHVPAAVRERARHFKYNLLAPLFALNVALGEPPRYKAATARPELDRAFMVILGLERLEQFNDIVTAHEAGDIPPTVMWGACPTLFDPSQAPAGRQTGFMWEKLPYALRGDSENWKRETASQARRMVQVWRTAAPNLTDDTILDSFARSPVDTADTLPNMRFGDLLVGSFANDQIGYNRPFAGAGQYRTPVSGLYLCGGSTHPGGNITGLCGYNAAQVLAADLGLRVWWSPPDAESALSNL